MAAMQDDLHTLLGREPAGLEELPTADRQTLAGILRAAQRTQEKEYDDAFEKALSHVPALLRGTIRKIITG